MGPDLWLGSFILMTSSSTSPTGSMSLCVPASQNCALAKSEAGNVSPLGSVRYTMRPIISWICKGWTPEAGRLGGWLQGLHFNGTVCAGAVAAQRSWPENTVYLQPDWRRVGGHFAAGSNSVKTVIFFEMVSEAFAEAVADSGA